ncbi:MAG: dUTP diphosphatase [Hyphomicrobiaceae bacterium]|nr:dUTP diphosphatase [Hyphomicrobiaceae bacterium]
MTRSTSLASPFDLKLKILPHGEGLPLPAYHSIEAAGADLAAAVPENEPLILQPGRFVLVPAGLAMALRQGYEAQIRPRSGLAFKYGVTVLNAPGTIDADYRGEIKVLLINHGSGDFKITRGLRIAQMIIAPVVQVRFEPVAKLDDSARGSAGFGSTGS